MARRPKLHTKRLLLRPFSLDDAPEVARLAGDPEISRTTLSIPYPYPKGKAEAWILSHEKKFKKGNLVNFAIERLSDQALLGAIGLRLEQDHARAELGFWNGRPYWSQGYCTEAAFEVVKHAVTSLKLNRIYAHHFTNNPASGRVLQKIGMQHEGTRRKHTLKDGVYLDSEIYAILWSEYSNKKVP